MPKIILLLPFLLAQLSMSAQVLNCTPTINYGANDQAGRYADINGIRMYYETYGDPTKQPLLLIHGNGGSVKAGSCQIEFFKEDYYVIIADSRYQGKSGTGAEELTYTIMASDYNALLDQLGVDSVHIIGQSDGGIIGLLLAMDYPSKVNKVIAAAPNLRSDTTALYSWSIDRMRTDMKNVESEIANGDDSDDTYRRKGLLQLMLHYPNISVADLKRIEAPVLLVFGDSDYMPYEHVIEMYQHIPRAHLFIMPGAGHRTYRLEPAIFNLIAQRFFDNPFTRPSAKDGH